MGRAMEPRARAAAPSAGTLPADVARAAAGDREAFRRLYEGTVARVHTLARRLLGAGAADAATQDAYLAVWRGLASFRGEARFETWLHRLVLNVFLKERGRRAARPEVRELGADEPAGGASRVELALDLEAAIAALPDGARRVFVLHDVEGHRHREIAALTGTSVGTSKSQLFRARMLLRAALGKEHGSADDARAVRERRHER